MRIESFPPVEGANLHLRPLDLADIDAWYEYLSRPHVLRHTSWSLKSSEELRPLIEQYNSDAPASQLRFAICSGPSQSLIGTIGFHTISVSNRTAEMAYDIHPAHWGRGIASACCRAVVAWAFAEHRYVRIQATVLDTNAASVRVLEKCGFTLEGKLRSLRMVRDEPRDFWVYSRLRTD